MRQKGIRLGGYSYIVTEVPPMQKGEHCHPTRDFTRPTLPRLAFGVEFECGGRFFKILGVSGPKTGIKW